MRALFAGSCAKDLGEDSANEDFLAFAADGSRLALCDGASESYDSKLWARQLAERFVADPRFSPKWIAEAASAYAAASDFDALSWSRQAAFGRGSFSTLLGVEHDRVHGSVDALAIGDCVAALVDGGALARAWPFADPERFKERPTLLSTLTRHNAFASLPGFWAASATTFELSGLRAPRVYCMSDALAEWALRQSAAGAAPWARLDALDGVEGLRRLVAEEREARRLRVDDSTLAILAFDDAAGEDAVSLP